MKVTLHQLAEIGDIFLINGNEVDLDIEEGDAEAMFAPWTEDTAVFRGRQETWVCSPNAIVELDDNGEGTLKVNEGDWQANGIDPDFAIEVKFKALVRVPITSEYLLRKSIGIR